MWFTAWLLYEGKNSFIKIFAYALMLAVWKFHLIYNFLLRGGKNVSCV